MRVSYGDIGKRAGVSKATVHRCLRNDPKASADTTARIQKIACEMGYRKDDLFDPLNQSRGASVEGKYTRRISFIGVNMKRENVDHLRLCESIRSEAEKFDLELEVHDLGEFQSYSDALQELRNRGIIGIILDCESINNSIRNLKFDDFALICCGEAGFRPMANSVEQNAVAALRQAYERSASCGLHRIGLIHAAEGVRHGYLQGLRERFLKATCGDSASSSSFRLEMGEPSKEQFDIWVKEFRPQVLWGDSAKIVDCLTGWGYRIPEDFPYVDFNLCRNADPFIGGIRESYSLEGVMVVRHLYRQIVDGDRGQPESQWTLRLEPSWVEGESLGCLRCSSQQSVFVIMDEVAGAAVPLLTESQALKSNERL